MKESFGSSLQAPEHSDTMICMTTNTNNLTHRQRILVRANKTDSAGGLLSETEVREVIYLQHSKRMPGFLQCDSDGAIVYFPESSLIERNFRNYLIRINARYRNLTDRRDIIVTDIRLLDERTIAATELDGTDWEIKLVDISEVRAL